MFCGIGKSFRVVKTINVPSAHQEDIFPIRKRFGLKKTDFFLSCISTEFFNPYLQYFVVVVIVVVVVVEVKSIAFAFQP